MSTPSSFKPSSSKNSMSTSNGSGGGRTGIPTLRSLRTLFAPTSSQAKSVQVSPSRPSLNLPASRPSINLMPSRSSLNIHSGGSDTSPSTSSFDIVRRSMTLGKKAGSRSVSRDSRDLTKKQQEGDKSAPVMDIRSSSPETIDGGGVDLSTIVEADTSGMSGISLAESLSKHLPALPTFDSPPPSVSHSTSPSPSFSPSPSPSPHPRSPSASASSLHLPRSPSSIQAQVHSALQVDSALAAFLSPNNLPPPSLSPSAGSASPSPGVNDFPLYPTTTGQTSSSSLPQHASTPHSSMRIKNVSHLGLMRPAYIRSTGSDDSRSFAASISRPGSSVSAPRQETNMTASASASASVGRNTFSAARTRTRSMSVDEQSPRQASGAGLITSRRDSSFLIRRQNYKSHTRSLSQFGDHDKTQSEAGDVRPSSQRNVQQRPPITEWLGPRTAKAFKAAGLLASQSHDSDSISSQRSHPYLDSNSSPSLSVPSSPVRARFRPVSYASDISYSPNSPNSHSPSPPYPSNIHTPHPRSASVAASAISARSGGSVRSASIRSGSVRSASTAPTSLSTSLGPSAPAQAAREYLMQSQNQQQKFSSSSSTLNLPTTTSLAPSSSVNGAPPSEVQLLKDQHSIETSALLAALSDAQRTTRVLRVENAELRAALTLAENKQESWEQEKLQLKLQLEEVEDRLKEVRGRKREDLKFIEEIKGLHKAKAGLISKLDEAEARLMQAEGKLCVLNEIKTSNYKLRQALHVAQRDKARVEAEAEMRAEEALRRIEQLEEALSEASGAIDATLGMAKMTDGLKPNANGVYHNPLTTNISFLDSQIEFRKTSKINSRTSSESPPLSSASSSRPPSIFPLPPDNMSLLMHEEAEGTTRTGEQSASSELDDLSSFETNRVQYNRKLKVRPSQESEDAENFELDASESKWRQSMQTPMMEAHPSTPFPKSIPDPRHNLYDASASISRSRLGSTSFSHLTHTYSSDDHDSLYPDPDLASSHVKHPNSSHHSLHSEYEYEDEAVVGNTTFYDAGGPEEDSIISEDEDRLLDLDPDPTVRANLRPDNLSHVTSLSRSPSDSHHHPLKLETTKATASAEPGNEDDGATTSFEGTGTPGSPGSLLWMHPLDERHLGDLNGSVDSLRLDA
ncbi:hypothetical protein HHX47_DHR7000011 [Lentinula edodes]|nr:hypothetical protein HHX47_DHR7000011 [Lentinula edodes]